MTVGKSNAFGRRLTDRRSGRKKPFALTSEIPRERKPVQLTLRLDLQEARQHNFRSRAGRRHYPRATRPGTRLRNRGANRRC
jgi:hypothetical protein